MTSATLLGGVVLLLIVAFFGAFGPTIALAVALAWNWLLTFGLRPEDRRRRLVGARSWYNQIRRDAHARGHGSIEIAMLLIADWARGLIADLSWRWNQEATDEAIRAGFQPTALAGDVDFIADAHAYERASLRRINLGDDAGWYYFANARLITHEGLNDLLRAVPWPQAAKSIERLRTAQSLRPTGSRAEH